MKSHNWRLWTLFLFAFILLPGILAQAQKPLVGNDVLPAREQDSFVEDHPGAAAFAEADQHLAKLRRISQLVNTKYRRYNKSSDFISTTVYYAQKIFKFLFLNAPSQTESSTSSTKSRRVLGEPLTKAISLLEGAVDVKNVDALYTLADINFYGRYEYPRDYARAFQLYNELAALNGNSTAQHMVGFMYATGIGGAVEKDQAKALLYHTFAADAGNTRSQMTVAYRHHAGIATPKSCEKSLHYYKKAAEKSMQYIKAGPPGGRAIVKAAYRLADEEGGVYGEGASVSSAGPNAVKGGPMTDAHAAFDDVLEYLDLMSRQGELKATFGLARLHYEGSRGLQQDYQTAKEHFLDIARRYWAKDGKVKPDPEPGVESVAAKAAGYLGRMFLRGEGMEQNFLKAEIWFRRGLQNGDALCHYSLGLMYLEGHGVTKDPVKAAEYFSAAADQDLASAQVQLGKLLLDQGDLTSAIRHFDFGARNGHIEAFYLLADAAARGIGRDRSCMTATLYYKIVAEKAETILTDFTTANEAYEHDDLDTALLEYMIAAEQGWEAGQANVAYLLDRDRAQSPLVKFFSFLPVLRKRVTSAVGDAALALMYWTRSAKQANIDSMVKMGDYYLEGVGTMPDSERAAACYQAAVETLQSAQAFWNLGWMHENGIGIEQDFHLAKRYYDQSLEANPREAYLPVTLALTKLRLRSWWNTVTRGKINSIHDEPSQRKRFNWHDFVARFLEADLEQYEEAALAREEAMVNAGLNADEWDTTTGHIPGDGAYDDVVEGAIFDDGMLDTLIIVGIVTALAFLMYIRGQQARQGRERQRQNGDEAADDRGVFPERNAPEFNDWVAGGIGH